MSIAEPQARDMKVSLAVAVFVATLLAMVGAGALVTLSALQATEYDHAVPAADGRVVAYR